MEFEMRSLNAKLAVSALSILTILASPAFAQKAHRHSSQQHATDPVDPNGRGLYNVVPPIDPSGRGIYDMVPAPDNPAATGGGSAGYNQTLRDNKW